jgi:hypothetical protein
MPQDKKGHVSWLSILDDRLEGVKVRQAKLLMAE